MARYQERLKSIRWGKVSAYLAACIIAAALLFLLAQNYLAEPYLKRQINTVISQSSPAFRSRIGELQFSLFSHQIQLTDLQISRTDSNITAQSGLWATDTLTIQNIRIKGIHYLPLLFGNKLEMNSLSIINPHLEGYLIRGKETRWAKSFNINKRLYDYITPRFRAVQIDDLTIIDFQGFAFNSDDRKHVVSSITNLNFHLFDIRIDSLSARQESLLPTSHFRGSADRLSWHPAPGLYDLNIDQPAFSSSDSIITAAAIHLNPRFKKYDFSRHVGHEIDRISLIAGQTRLTRVALDSLLQKKAFTASSLSILDARLDVFHDKKQPSLVNTDKTFPHLLFRRIDFPIRLDSIFIRNADLYYGEHHNLVPKPGTISFEDTDAIISNIYSVASHNPADSMPTTMQVTSHVQGRGLLKANFTFPHDPAGSHHITGSLGPISMRVFNRPLKYLARVELNGGKIQAMNFDMDLGPRLASGTVHMQYTGLDVEVIDFNQIYEKDQNKLKSFIANRFLIKKENTPPLHEGRISYRRNPEKSIFNYWWKSLLSGLKSSVGL